MGRLRNVGRRRYDWSVPISLFEDMKLYVGFGDTEAATLAETKQALVPVLPGIVDMFYTTLRRHPRARVVLGGDPERSRRLRTAFHQWLEDLFCGRYDDEYFKQRCKIGRAHVLVELPQYYMFTGMNVVRLALVREIQSLKLPDAAGRIVALEKLLDLELAIMNQTYREDLLRRMQELERDRYEVQLSEAKHLATVGELAASLAHEIKNPLAGISGAIQIIGAGLDADHPHKEIVNEALRQIDRLDTTVKDLLIYARPKPPAKTRLDLNELVERVLLILRGEAAFRSIRIRNEPATERLWMDADESQLQQLMTNLLINAAHATAEEGSIECKTSRTRRGMRIVVRDHGVGMEPDVLARVCEPFYTTKARGTGLGMSICKRIVEAHGGALRISSTPGKGTQVDIQLPADSPAGSVKG